MQRVNDVAIISGLCDYSDLHAIANEQAERTLVFLLRSRVVQVELVSSVGMLNMC